MGEGCFHVKFFFNKWNIVNSLRFCDTKTHRCGFDRFKKEMIKQMVPEVLENKDICFTPFDSKMLYKHRFTII